jgi:hypothetical protein
MFSGQRKMKLEEANSIAAFLGVPVSDVLIHAGVVIDREGTPPRIQLEAIIDEGGILNTIATPILLPASFLDAAKRYITLRGGDTIRAAQVRASFGPLSAIDDAIVLFSVSAGVDPAAIGSLSICLAPDGSRIVARIERARKTGEATIVGCDGVARDMLISGACPVLAIIP